mgnify:CR=1 FL=1
MIGEMFIGIDPGTHCGWAVLDPAGSVRGAGTWHLDNRAGDGAGMRYLRFERLLRELLATFPHGPVAYELVSAHKGADAAHVYGGLVAIVTRLCEELARPYTGAAVGTVKKYATGKGNSNKVAMMDAAAERWAPNGHERDDNEADALWIAEVLRLGLV